MKKILGLLLLLCVSITLWGVKPHKVPALIRQSDGTELMVYSYGGCSIQHWYTTSDGALLVHIGTDYYIASVNDNGELVATTQLAHEKEIRNNIEKQYVEAQNKELFYQTIEGMKAKILPRRERIGSDATYFPHIGSPKAIVILADFSDEKFLHSDDTTKMIFEQYLNSRERPTGVPTDQTVRSNHGSIYMYFNEMSRGKFTPQFDLYGPVHLNHPLKYYGEGSDNIQSFMTDVCKAVDEEIDFSHYDANNDGFVDLVYVIYAGYAESYSQNSSDCIWPKSGTTSAGTYDGKTVYRFGVHAELNAYPGAFTKEPYKRISGAGLFCHEFSHTMGLPDFYTTETPPYDNTAMEDWDLMDGGEYVGGGYYPTEYTAWERETMGWIPIDTLSQDGTYSLTAMSAGGTAYRIMNDSDPNMKECFILENIQQTGWNSKLRGHGMLITHANYKGDIVNILDYPNYEDKAKPRMTIVAADGLLISSYSVQKNMKTKDEYYESYAGDPFPGSGNVTSISDKTPVNWPIYNGESLKKSLFNIVEANQVVTFNFVNGDIPSGISPSLMQDDLDSKEIHSIDGRYLGKDPTTLKKGIYIINHQKVIIM